MTKFYRPVQYLYAGSSSLTFTFFARFCRLKGTAVNTARHEIMYTFFTCVFTTKTSTASFFYEQCERFGNRRKLRFSPANQNVTNLVHCAANSSTTIPICEALISAITRVGL